MRVATDVGGTFTDYVILKPGKVEAFKALTTHDASEGIKKQLKNLALTEFSHGTTAAVNAALERKGAPVVFFTTKGYRDLVHIARQARINVYSFISELPRVPVHNIVEVNERTDADGTVLQSISMDELKTTAKEYSKRGKVAVVGFINSYVNPENELYAEKVLQEHFSVVISSHKVRREIREYDRFCTALMEGYCLPVLRKYLSNLEPLTEQFYLMQSNGGRARIEHLRAVNMIMSGPAGGVAATQALCAKLGIKNAIAYDMGGTSADVCALVDGVPLYSDTIYIDNIPIKTLAIHIESIGAGGGSIAWVDDGGALKVGPVSAGSDPGPACYGQGGKKFTVSDANLIIGVLGKKISGISLNGEKALEAAKPLCHDLGLDLMELSHGVIQIVNNNMVSALKRISIGKGYDPRNFTLVSFGGAGPMHACAIAEILGIKRIIVPPYAGAFSALGILNAPIRFDYVHTILSPLNTALDLIPKALVTFHSDLKQKVHTLYKNTILQPSVDMRYLGQGHEINIPFTQNLATEFHSKHQELFGFNIPDNPVEVVNVKMVAELPAQELELKKYKRNEVKVRSEREVYPDERVCIYSKDFHGSNVEGPCIIEDVTSTIYVKPAWNANLDLQGVLHLERD